MAALSCSSELTNNAAPVELVVTNTQNLSRLDLDPLSADTDCAGDDRHDQHAGDPEERCRRATSCRCA